MSKPERWERTEGMQKQGSWEWATTSGETGLVGSLGDFHPFETITPKEPLGIDWEICSTAATRGRIFWTWRRPKRDSRGGRKR